MVTGTSRPARDFFICHASEDKAAIAGPLAHALQARGWSVWFDEFELNVGDRLSEKIDDGLRRSVYGIVILSRAFFRKHWPKEELEGLADREARSRRKVILPVWHKIKGAEVADHSHRLAGRVAVPSTRNLHEVIAAIERAVESEGHHRSGPDFSTISDPARPALAARTASLRARINWSRLRPSWLWIAAVVVVGALVGLLLATQGADKPGQPSPLAGQQASGGPGRASHSGSTPKPIAPVSPRLDISVANWCFCGNGEQSQVKIKPRLTNRSHSRVGIGVGGNSHLVLALPANETPAHWTNETPHTVSSVPGWYLVTPSPDGQPTYPLFATHWTGSVLQPGQSFFDPRVKQGDLVFSVPYKRLLPESVRLAYIVQGKRPYSPASGRFANWGPRADGNSF